MTFRFERSGYRESYAAEGEADASIRADKSFAFPSLPRIAREFNDPYLELIRLLRGAAEIEHALMVQYLYAAFSIKSKYEKLRGDGSLGQSRDLLGVAIQEMHHMHKVNLMLAWLHSEPNLNREDFPFQTGIYPFELNLQRLDSQSLARYVYVEAAANSIDPAHATTPDEIKFLKRLYDNLPSPIQPNHLGSLYNTIIEITKELLKKKPYPGCPQAEIYEWIEELQKIKRNGEEDHFRFFRDLFMGKHRSFTDPNIENVWDLPDTHEDFPSLAVPKNPSAHRNHPNEIKDVTLRNLAWLSDLHYWIILSLLDLHYRYDRPKPSAKARPRPYMALARRHMRGPLLKLGLHLAEKKAGAPFDTLSLGYSAGRDEKESQHIVRRIVLEAKDLAHKLGSTLLPSGFKLNIYEITLNELSL